MTVRTRCLRGAVVCLVALALSAALGAADRKPAAGPTPIRVDGKIIKGYIDYMASDDKEGRRSLTPGYEKVAEWAAAKFKEWGLKPAGDNGTFLQDVPVTGRGSGQPWTTGTPSLAVDGRPFYLNDGDFTVDPASTPGARADAEVVFVGYGISAPGKGLDEYAGVDVKGRVVLALKGSPKDAPPARGMFGAVVAEAKDNEAWTDEARDQAKIKTAYDKGAAAILLFNTDRLSPAAPVPGVIDGAADGAGRAAVLRPSLRGCERRERAGLPPRDVPEPAGDLARLPRAHGPVAA